MRVKGRKAKPRKPSAYWELGAAARANGAPITDNPYPAQTSEFYRWREGWQWQEDQQR